MGQLADWAKKQSKNLILDDEETIEGVYQGFKIGVNPFDAEKELAFYKIQVMQDGEAITKIFKSTSGKAARFFDERQPGQRVRITRHGKGSETKYDFADVAGSALAPSDESELEA